ncbi:alcohol acetyltransferase [Fennellomyces sp. T-0311]|nr:alcohol acetyltransferase [Fennellomyces sp. T-0311]
MRTERPLGLLEKYQVSKQLTRCYGCVTSTVIFRHSARPDSNARQFYLNQLHAPLTSLVEKHPQLSLVVAENSKSTAHFLRLDSFNLDSVVEIKEFSFWNETELGEVIGKECDREFDLDNHTVPLWHLTIGIDAARPNECSITLAAHHVIMDGKSLAQFWQDLDLGRANEPEDYQIRCGETALLESYENRGAPMPSTLDLLPIVGKMLVKKMLPTRLTEHWFPEGWAGDVAGDKKETHDTTVRVVQVGGTTWSNVCATCRDHGVTPHAAIMAALVEAFTRLWPDTSVKTTTPVNCRSFAQVPPGEMGNFVGSYGYLWTGKAMPFWERAKTYHRLLKANKAGAAKEAGQLKYLSKYPEDYYDFWHGHWNNPMARSGGIELSDLGRVVLDKAWQVQSVWFCQSAQTFTTALSVNSISTQDSMYATIGWQKGSVDESKTEALSALLREILEKST